MNKITWSDRYSSSDEPDDLGRWARVGYLQHLSGDIMKQIQIAWIKKFNTQYVAYVYIGEGRFKNNFDTLEEAKSFCQASIKDFYINYL